MEFDIMRIMKITLCFTLVGLFFVNCVAFSQDEWQFKPGVIMASGDQMHVLKNVDGQLLTVNGYRRISKAKLADVSVYHALVFYPKSTIIGGGGSISNDGPLSTETITWKLQKNTPNDYKNTEEKSLEIKYHALDRTVSIGSETFSISNGNLFVIRLNGSWIPTITQIPAHFDERAEEQGVLDFFKSVLREDDSIQKLELS